MKKCVKNQTDNRKIWVAPELKKIEVEKLTAHPFNFGDT
jgi:hypothetical protein